MTVLPEDAWSRVKPVRQIGQAVLPRSYRRRRLFLPVFRDMPGDSNSQTATAGKAMTKIDPIHPGEHLAEFLDELGISQYRLAKVIGTPPRAWPSFLPTFK